MFLTLLLIFFVTVLFCYNYNKHKYWKDRHVPTPYMVPFLGQMAPIIFRRKSFANWLQEFYNSSDGRYVGIMRFTEPALFLRDLDLYKKIFIKDFDSFVDHQNLHLSDDLDPLFSNSLVFLRGQKWKDMRSTISPAFTSSKMKSMFILMRETAEQFVSHFSKQVSTNKSQTIDVKDAFTRYTSDVVANCAFGIKSNSLEDRENVFFKKGMEAIRLSGFRSLKLMGYIMFPKLMEFFSVRVIEKELQDFFMNVMMENMAYREKEGVVRMDMVHLLMEARKGRLEHEETVEDDTGFATAVESNVGHRKKDLTDNELIGQAFVFLSAGSEPTAVLVSLIAYELALNPDIQLRLQQEVDAVTASSDEPITYEQLLKMKYLDMVLCETLRKWPPGLVQDRLCVKPYTIHPEDPKEKPLHLVKGDLVVVSIYAFHRDPKYFPDPEKFDPERFNEENKHNIQPLSYMPFGVGPRNCIGSRFALLQVKTIIYYLLSSFELTVVDETPIPIKLAKLQFTLNTDHEIWLGLKKRNV